MFNKSMFFLKSAIGIFVILVSHMEVFSQPIWLDRSHDKTIAYEFLKPDFENLEGTTFFTSAMFLTGRFATSKTLIMVAEIPFVNYGRDSESGESYNESAFGNPYLGVEVHSEKSNIFGEFGFRLPMAPKDENQSALLIGAFTDFVERVDAFRPEIISFNALINYSSVNESNLGLRVRGGFTGWISSGDRDENDWFLVYGVHGGYQTEQINILLGLSGRYWLSADNVEFSESIFHQFVVTTNISLGSVQPGLILKLPLNENLQDMINLVFGVSLAVNLN